MDFHSDVLSVKNGKGTITLFGDVDLELDPEVRTIEIPGLSDLWSLLKRQFIYRVRVRGTLCRPSATLEALPFLHGPGPKGPRVVPKFLGEFKPVRGRRF